MRPAGANLVLLLSGLAIAALLVVFFGLSAEQSVKYSEFKDMVASGKVESVTFEGDVVSAVVKPETKAEPGPVAIPVKVRTIAVPGDESLVALLQEK